MTAKEKILFDKIWSYYVNAFPINQNKIGELLENLKNEAVMDEDEVLTVEEMAKKIKVSVGTLRNNWEAYGGFKVAGSVRFTMRKFMEKGEKNERKRL